MQEGRIQVVGWNSFYPQDIHIYEICSTGIYYYSSTSELLTHRIYPTVTSCKRIIRFLWVASQCLIKFKVAITQESGHVKQFKDDLQERFILTGTLSAPDTSKVAGPFDITLSALSGSIIHLTTHLEKDSTDRKSDKDAKKKALQDL